MPSAQAGIPGTGTGTGACTSLREQAECLLRHVELQGGHYCGIIVNGIRSAAVKRSVIDALPQKASLSWLNLVAALAATGTSRPGRHAATCIHAERCPPPLLLLLRHTQGLQSASRRSKIMALSQGNQSDMVVRSLAVPAPSIATPIIPLLSISSKSSVQQNKPAKGMQRRTNRSVYVQAGFMSTALSLVPKIPTPLPIAHDA